MSDALDDPVAAVTCSWILLAALSMPEDRAMQALAHRAAELLQSATGGGGLVSHMIPAGAAGRRRAHVGCFADQVYPIMSLARYARATGDDCSRAAASTAAQAICELQGPAGQWWWHYDARGRSVVERYPVYSVHQHAMAPMALRELQLAGGGDHQIAIAAGLRWLAEHPEARGELISTSHSLIWRKIGRVEPRKAARTVAAALTAVRPGLTLPMDWIMPPGRIDYECRPYELGWLLYAWRGHDESGASTAKATP